MKLELKHLSAYLPYGLTMYWEDFKNTPQKPWVLSIESDIRLVIENQNKPILRPLSDLTKEIEHNGEVILPVDYWDNHLKGIKFNYELSSMAKHNYCDFHLPYFIMDKLFQWHFDVFGLIPAGLAIDINTIEK